MSYEPKSFSIPVALCSHVDYQAKIVNETPTEVRLYEKLIEITMHYSYDQLVDAVDSDDPSEAWKLLVVSEAEQEQEKRKEYLIHCHFMGRADAIKAIRKKYDSSVEKYYVEIDIDSSPFIYFNTKQEADSFFIQILQWWQEVNRLNP